MMSCRNMSISDIFHVNDLHVNVGYMQGHDGQGTPMEAERAISHG